MDIRKITTTAYEIICKWPKKRLLEAIKALREKYQEIEKQNKQLIHMENTFQSVLVRKIHVLKVKGNTERLPLVHIT